MVASTLGWGNRWMSTVMIGANIYCVCGDKCVIKVNEEIEVCELSAF